MLNVSRGDIVFVKLDGNGSQQKGDRPALVVSNDINNKFSPVLQIVTLTTRLNKNPLPTHKVIEKGIGNLKTTSVALCETLTSISKENVSFKIGSVDTYTMNEINQGVKIQLGIA